MARTTSSSDERCGYNFSVIIDCSECLAGVEVGSKHDKGGWCNESRESAIARAADQWNRRAQPEANADAKDAQRLDWEIVSKAANEANTKLGAWMPMQWVQAFVAAYDAAHQAKEKE